MRGTNDYRKFKLTPSSIVPMSETLISLTRERGPLQATDWDDGSILASSFTVTEDDGVTKTPLNSGAEVM